MYYSASTDIGKHYSHNEDFYALPDSKEDINTILNGHLFVLCDGMEGGNAGEVASQMASRWLFHDYYETPDKLFTVLVKEVSDSLYNLSVKYAQYKGMGTTLVTALFKDNIVDLYNVGDSRGYLFRDENLEQLTEDQSEVWELYKMGQIEKKDIISHPRNHIITQALGLDNSLSESDVNHVQVKAQEGDIFLLCSDGLTDMVIENRITEILKETVTLDEKGDALVEAANNAGGKDNITVILIKI